MLEPDDTVVAGVSGGADSVCLLFMLLDIQKQIPFQLEAVHVNHGIRQEAGSDEAYVRSICSENNIPFHLTQVNIKEISRGLGISEEEAGRQVRYKAFEEALQKNEAKGKIAVAHNSNDRAETMLFHLFRGTGLTGAPGIRAVNGNIIRPLLCIERSEIEAWLSERKIPYCRDISNDGDAYTRNRIRHHILPYAETEICRGAVAHMNMAAENLAAADNYIENQTIKAMQECVAWNEENTLAKISLIRFLNQDSYLQGRILLACIKILTKDRKDISQIHIRSVRSLLESECGGSRELHLPYGLIVNRQYDNCIITFKEQIYENILSDKEYPVQIPGSMKIPGLGTVVLSVFLLKNSQGITQKKYTKWFDYDKITKSVIFRTRNQGDYLTIDDKLHHKSLKDYFIDNKVPKDVRDSIYVLAEDSHIIWVPGYRISEYYKVQNNTHSVLQMEVTITDLNDISYLGSYT